MIILIPLAKMMNGLLESYREVLVVDSLGRSVGTVVLNSHNKDIDGNTYNPHDPY